MENIPSISTVQVSLNRLFLFSCFILIAFSLLILYIFFFFILSLAEFNFHIMMMKFLGNWVKSVHTHKKHCFNKTNSVFFSLFLSSFFHYYQMHLLLLISPSLLLICMICLRSKSFYLFQLNYFSEVCYAKEEV